MTDKSPWTIAWLTKSFVLIDLTIRPSLRGTKTAEKRHQWREITMDIDFHLERSLVCVRCALDNVWSRAEPRLLFRCWISTAVRGAGRLEGGQYRLACLLTACVLFVLSALERDVYCWMKKNDCRRQLCWLWWWWVRFVAANGAHNAARRGRPAKAAAWEPCVSCACRFNHCRSISWLSLTALNTSSFTDKWKSLSGISSKKRTAATRCRLCTDSILRNFIFADCRHR